MCPVRTKGVPHPPRCFLRKSAETIEKKRVEFFLSAKKRKRVRKDVKRKNLSSVPSGEWRVAGFELEWIGPHPRCFLEVRILKGLQEKNA